MTTVLILDDDASNLQALSAIFSAQGYEVLEATTGEEAIHLSNDDSDVDVDLFVCDVGLGASSGTEVALRFCKVHPKVPILFVSGTPMYAWEKRDVNNFLKLSLDTVDCLEKPFHCSALLATANKLIEKIRGRTGGSR